MRRPGSSDRAPPGGTGRGGAAIAIIEAALVIGLLLLWWRGWQHGPPPVDFPAPVALPAWTWWVASAADLCLHGPDAGDWASSARAIAEGVAPVARRPPLYPLAIAALSTWTGTDLVLGGHLLNHLLGAATLVATWLLGRQLAGPAGGIGAALVVTASPALRQAEALYGVDTTFTFLVLAVALVGTWAFQGGPRRTLLLGAVAGLLPVTHFVGFAFLPVVVLASAVQGRPRWLLASLATVGMVASLTLAGLLFTVPGAALVLDEVRVGILTTFSRPDLDRGAARDALEIVLAGAPRALVALAAALPEGARSSTALGRLVLPLLLVGVLVRPRRQTLWLAFLLCPLIPLGFVAAPERYRLFAIPLLAVGAMRGVQAVGNGLPAWARVPATTLASLLLAASAAHPLPSATGTPLPDEAVHQLRVAALFPPGPGHIVARSQELRFYSGRTGCQLGMGPRAVTLAARLAQLRRRCPGAEWIYVIDSRPPSGFEDQPDVEMEAWVRVQGEPLGTVSEGSHQTEVYRLRFGD